MWLGFFGESQLSDGEGSRRESGTLPRMTGLVQAGGSIVTGVVLALFTILGGVSAITPGANAPEASDQVVMYDGR